MSAETPESGGSQPSADPPVHIPDRPVFVSYASQDVAIAHSIVEALERQGFKCWIAPRDVVPGALYADEIVRAINESKVVVLVLSEQAVASPHVGKEIERASSKRRRIVALRTDSAALTRAFEYFLSESQWIDVGSAGIEAIGAKLVDAVRRHLAPGADVAPAASSDRRTLDRKSATPQPRWILIASVAVLAMALAYFVVEKFWLSKHATSERPIAALTPAVAPAAPAISEKSIAVLPFIDMSEKHDQEYFSDGLAEELIDMLTKVPGVRVPARTSSFYFKGKQTTIAEIAKMLGVAHILEGSVRKSGTKLRVTAQLIRASDGYHIWSETFDRQLDDIFRVQDEIGAAVVTHLKITLLGSAPQSKTTDPKAYVLFLEGTRRGHEFTKDGLESATGLFQQALAIDPNYAAAWVGLAGSYINQTITDLRPRGEGVRLAREAALKAIEIDPDLAIAYSALGSLASRFDADYAAAAQYYQRALQLQPSNSMIVRNAATFAFLLGRLDTAIALQRYANARDPLGNGHQNLGIYYIHAGRLDEGVAELTAAVSLNRKPLYAFGWMSMALLLKGNPKAALAAIQQESDEGQHLSVLAMIRYALRQKEDSDAALAELIKRGEDVPIACVLAFRGEPDRAFEWLENAASKNELRGNSIATDPDFANLHGDARWLPLLRKIGAAPEQLALINFDVKLPE